MGQLRGFVPLSKMDPARLPRNAQGAPGNGGNGGNGSNGLTPKDLAHLVGKPIAAKIIQVCPRTTANFLLLILYAHSAAHMSSKAVQRMLNRSLSAAFEAKISF